MGWFTVEAAYVSGVCPLGTGTGAQTGKVQFDPLMVDLAGLPSELVTLLKAATTGEHIASVELVGLKLEMAGRLRFMTLRSTT